MLISKHTFIRVGDTLYINVKLSLLEVFLYLYFRGKPFSLFDRKTKYSLFSLVPNLTRIIRVLQFSQSFYKEKKNYQRSKDVKKIATQSYGHCLLELRQGEYKVINFLNKEVKTIFTKFSSADCKDIINNLRVAEKCKLAPRIIKWDLNSKCSYLIEEYINFKRPSYNLIYNNRISSEIFPTLEKIMRSTNSKIIPLEDYINNFKKLLDFYIMKFQMTNCNDYRILKTFFLKYIKLIKANETTDEVLLVFSHGDFWEGNILTKNKKLRVIDWTTLDYRSCFFDFFYFMFMVASKNKPFETVDREGLLYLEKVLDDTFVNFSNKITENRDGNFISDNNLEVSESYRYIFYLELIILKLKESDLSSNPNLKGIITWIKRFEFFEEEKLKLYEVNMKTNKI